MYRTPDEAVLLRRLGLSCGMSGLLKLLKVGRETLSLQVDVFLAKRQGFGLDSQTDMDSTQNDASQWLSGRRQ